MIKRFQGEAGRAALLDALREQKLVAGNTEIAQRMADVSELIEVSPGTVLIEQDAADNDVYFIIAGAFDVVVNGRKLYRRFPNDHVGEMAAIQAAQRRSATIIATEPSVVCKLSAAQFIEFIHAYPDIWRLIAKELARRILQRNAFVTQTHDRIRVFIICSVEALPIARAIETAFDHDAFNIILWTDGVFRASWYPIESLEQQLDQSDFAIAIAQPDDQTQSRGETTSSPRDNVIFELGMFIGRLGRHRSFLVEPRGEEIRLPSDLTGVTVLTYKIDDGKPRLGPACSRLREIINELGPNN
jgi:predicted nucleotide-binding protein